MRNGKEPLLVEAAGLWKAEALDGPERSSYYSLMKKASISETKNHLSRLLEEVKQGTTILILDRATPVARLEPVAADEQSSAGRVAALVRQGLATAPRRRFDSAAFLSRRMIRLPEGVSAVQALLADREEER